MAGKPQNVLDRLANKFTVGDDCWEWAAAKTKLGYGKFSQGGKYGGWKPAHRVVYELLVGPIPDGLDLDHLCRNTSCVRPAHLEPVTNAENVRRAMEKTHCSNGHELATESYQYSYGRYCRPCQLVRSRERAARCRGDKL